MINAYERRFNEKIDSFKGHPKYETLRKSADSALSYHRGYGLDAIHAQDFMDRIVKMPLQYIQAWLDGLNSLEWTEEYEKLSMSDVLNSPIQ